MYSGPGMPSSRDDLRRMAVADEGSEMDDSTGLPDSLLDVLAQDMTAILVP
eukprot:CAMPEP_0118944110 /NCGR_PEP_ID=MMETSP1169-20130426/39666_1 /TAXON_ID=36882 /ORGANISM="Pyramimonas obovata, Strain CCMP722" /LENGTH=50 /DNA_ID=CAMNT_0006889525 /DNA_START=232 /DNA_END=380 /DNA_ORIENTATION=+